MFVDGKPEVYFSRGHCFTMKSFKFARKYYQTLGIYSPTSSSQHNQKASINSQNLLFFISEISMFISTAGYFLFKATTFFERAETFYVSLTELICVFNFLNQFWQMSKILDLIQQFEDFIEKSEFEYFQIML